MARDYPVSRSGSRLTHIGESGEKKLRSPYLGKEKRHSSTDGRKKTIGTAIEG